MKNNSIARILKSIALLMVMMVAVTSCKSKMEKLMDVLPANRDLVVVGDVKTVVESMGGKVDGSEIKLPSDVVEAFGENAEDEVEDVVVTLKKSGMNAEACALVANFEDSEPTLVVMLEDKDKFLKYIKSEDYEKDEEEDGVIYYEKNDDYDCDYIAIKGSFAYLIFSVYDDDFKPQKFFGKLMDSAEEAPFGDTGMGEYIKEGNAAGVCVKLSKEVRSELEEEGLPSEIADMLKGYVCCRGNLKENTASVSFKMFNTDGKAMTVDDFDGKFNPEATVNPEALKFMDDDEFFVYAESMKDINWDDYKDILYGKEMSSDDQAIMIAVKAYLEKIDGTVAIGVGLTNGMASYKALDNEDNIDKELAATLVFESKKAESMISDIKVLLDNYTFPYETIKDGVKITIPGDGPGEVYTSWSIVEKDGFLVVSNREVRKNESKMFDGIDLGKTNSLIVLNLPASNQLMKDFAIEDDLKLALTMNTETLEVALNCEFGEAGKGSFLTAALHAFSGFVDEGEKYFGNNEDCEEEVYYLEDSLEYIAEEAPVEEEYYYED